jgi:hypothetical protein
MTDGWTCELREIAVGAVILAGPCQADHHGLCQAHNLQPLDACWVARFRKLLAADTVRNLNGPAPKFSDGMTEEEA